MQWQIAAPATVALIAYAHFRRALTPFGIAVAAFTALVHANHPWNLPFTLLCVFFLAGTGVTKIKHNYKATLTLSSKGTSGEGPRTHIQVLANSLIATTLTWMHTQQLKKRAAALLGANAADVTGSMCFSWAGDILPFGIIACYAAATADTFSSELGILARTEPRLITEPLRKVPKGTNGGATIEGLLAGLLGSSIIAVTSLYLLPFCGVESMGALGSGTPWDAQYRPYLAIGIAVWGLLGSIFDSWLGAQFQRTVKDVRTGKVVEGEGGTRALTTADEENRIKRAREARHDDDDEDSQQELSKQAPTTSSNVDDGKSNLKSRQTGGKVDTAEKTGKVEESKSTASRIVETGMDIFDNNDVNFAMTFFMSLSAMGAACQIFGKTFRSVQDI